MQCYTCTQEAVQECPRCGALYCDDHGDAMCARCMDPMLALPSWRVYRGSLLALLAATVLAVWLLIRPLGDGSDDGSAIASGFEARPPVATATVPPQAPAASPTATAEATASASPTPTATPTAQTYTVQPGDTLFLIAEQLAPPGRDPSAFASEIAALNGIADPSQLSVGQTLQIPQ